MPMWAVSGATMATVNVRDEYEALHDRADVVRDRGHFTLAQIYEVLARLLMTHSINAVLDEMVCIEKRLKG